MPRRLILVLAVVVAGCLKIPPPPGSEDAPVADAAPDAYVCILGTLPEDSDCDGWLEHSPGNPAASDCDDNNATINPGALDLAGDIIDQDCLGGDSAAHIAGVDDLGAGLNTTDLALGFNSNTGMPSSMDSAGAEALGGQMSPTCPTLAEEKIGVSLYPALAVHARATSNGSVAFERHGPAAASALVAWSIGVPATGDPSCMNDVVVAANIRFTVLPGGRLVRDDRITIDNPIDGGTGDDCTGCGQTDSPFFTSYFTLDPTYDSYRIGQAGTDQSFTLTQDQQLPRDDYRVCVFQSGGNAKLGFTWRFGAGDAGPRFRLTPNLPTSAVIYDWRRGAAVADGAYQAVTAVFAQDTPDDPCSVEMWETMDEYVTPTVIAGLHFVEATGQYEPDEPPAAGQLEFHSLGAIARGFGVRVGSLGSFGVTVWRKPFVGGTYVRQAGGADYLFQRDDDGTYSLWFLDAAAGEYFAISGPGAEPPP